MTARTPVGVGWRPIGRVADSHGAVAFGWFHTRSRTQVLSSVNLAKQPRTGTVGPQWHVSIVDRSCREPARCAFDMLVSEEDNHHPGNAVHFWLPIDPSERVECECKTDEVLVEEPDGYRWTNAADGPCRGCALEREMRSAGLSRPCPIHTDASGAPRLRKSV